MIISGVKRNTMHLEQRRAIYIRALEEDLKRIRQQLAAMPQVVKIILFGSYAAGRRDLFTDLDLLVIIESDLDFPSRMAVLYGQIRASVDVDLLAYTPEEFERMQSRGFVRHALATGKVIYERPTTG
jgi:predicted nucleotidyltransferase